MFANTLTLTIDGTGRTLTRNNQDNYGSEYIFEDATEIITLKIRHDTDNQFGKLTRRHNMALTRRIFGTPVADEKYFTTTATLRNRDGSAPVDLQKTQQGFATLLASLLSGFVVGEN